jgi:outer membrane protein TolC
MKAEGGNMERGFSYVVLLLALALSGTSAAGAEEAGTGKKTLITLDECVRRALVSAPELGEAQSDIALAASKLDEAKGYRLPQVEFLGLAGPVPQARGNQVSSPDTIDQSSRLTYYFKGDATITQPLYTFGKIGENMKAADHGIAADRAKKEQVRNEVALKVKEYYYGILLARGMKDLLLDVQDSLKKARDKAQQLFDEGSPNVVLEDIYKLDSFGGEVAGYLAEADKGEQLALAALRSRVGLAPAAEVDIATERLVPGEEAVPELGAVVATAKTRRPEFRQIEEGLKAREALVEAARADYFPDLFLAGYLSGAWAEKRDRVTNPWVPDQYNHGWVGVALGMKWKLDFGITGAKVEGKRAEYSRLLSTRAYAETNIPLQVKKFHLELDEAVKGIKATHDGYTNAKKWVVAAIANFDFGIGSAKEIFDALQQYAKMRAANYQAIYNEKLSRANLVYAAGEEPVAGK